MFAARRSIEPATHVDRVGPPGGQGMRSHTNLVWTPHSASRWHSAIGRDSQVSRTGKPGVHRSRAPGNWARTSASVRRSRQASTLEGADLAGSAGTCAGSVNAAAATPAAIAIRVLIRLPCSASGSYLAGNEVRAASGSTLSVIAVARADLGGGSPPKAGTSRRPICECGVRRRSSSRSRTHAQVPWDAGPSPRAAVMASAASTVLRRIAARRVALRLA